ACASRASHHRYGLWHAFATVAGEGQMVDERDWAWKRQELDAAVADIAWFRNNVVSKRAEYWRKRGRRDARTTRLLAFGALILATVAGASILGEIFGRTFTGIIALVSAVLTAAAGFLAIGPDELAKDACVDPICGRWRSISTVG